MTIDREPLRPAFEAWRRENYGADDFSRSAVEGEDYRWLDIEDQWKAWCAAFESLGEPVAHELYGYDGRDTLSRKPAIKGSHLFASSAPLYRIPEVKA